MSYSLAGDEFFVELSDSLALDEFSVDLSDALVMVKFSGGVCLGLSLFLRGFVTGLGSSLICGFCDLKSKR